MLSIVHFFVAFLALQSVHAQYPIPDNQNCENFCNSTRNVDPREFSGIYFMSYQLPYFFMNASKCEYVNDTRINESLTYFTFYERRISDNSDKLTDGFITFNDDGSVLVTYTNLKLPIPFKVISFNKDSFAFVQCNDCGYFSKKGRGLYVYIHTRIPYPSCDSLDQLMNGVAACGIPRDAIPQNDHSSCQKTC